MRKTLSLAVALALCGCSVTFGSRPTTPPQPHVACTESPELWILDIVGVAAATGLAIYGAVGVKNDDEGKVMTGLSILGGITYLASAGNGVRWTYQCHRQSERPGVANK